METVIPTRTSFTGALAVAHADRLAGISVTRTEQARAERLEGLKHCPHLFKLDVNGGWAEQSDASET